LRRTSSVPYRAVLPQLGMPTPSVVLAAFGGPVERLQTAYWAARSRVLPFAAGELAAAAAAAVVVVVVEVEVLVVEVDWDLVGSLKLMGAYRPVEMVGPKVHVEDIRRRAPAELRLVLDLLLRQTFLGANLVDLRLEDLWVLKSQG